MRLISSKELYRVQYTEAESLDKTKLYFRWPNANHVLPISNTATTYTLFVQCTFNPEALKIPVQRKEGS
jgi:hypothetical protein